MHGLGTERERQEERFPRTQRVATGRMEDGHDAGFTVQRASTTHTRQQKHVPDRQESGMKAGITLGQNDWQAGLIFFQSTYKGPKKFCR